MKRKCKRCKPPAGKRCICKKKQTATGIADLTKLYPFESAILGGFLGQTIGKRVSKYFGGNIPPRYSKSEVKKLAKASGITKKSQIVNLEMVARLYPKLTLWNFLGLKELKEDGKGEKVRK